MFRSSRPVLVFSCLAAIAAAPAVADRSGWEREVVRQQTLEIGSAGTLKIDVPDGDLLLETGPAGRVELEIEIGSKDLPWARQQFERMNFRAAADGGDVTLGADAIRSESNRWNGGLGITVRIVHPEAVDLDIRTGDGDIAIATVDGTLRIKSGDGDVSIGRARGDSALVTTGDGDVDAGDLEFGRVEVRTGDGDVQLTRVDADMIEVRTGDGDVDIVAASGSLVASTSDGELSVGFDRLGDTTLRSGDGDITIRGDGSLAADLDLHGSEAHMSATASFNGDVRESSIQGSINGGGPKLAATTRDGTVLLHLK